jgi:nitrite reductase/ring-hydroxylating ferredoxin subunit
MASDEMKSVSRTLISREDLPNRQIIVVNADIDGENESILLYRDQENIQAWLNICPHAGRRLDYAPGKFLMQDGDLVCAAHGASFRLDSGECVAGPCRGASLKAVAVEWQEDQLHLSSSGLAPESDG